mgnify:CR=1 FL=1
MCATYFFCSGVFCVKQKTAYEVEYGLVGSEMCIRDSRLPVLRPLARRQLGEGQAKTLECLRRAPQPGGEPVSYTHLSLPPSDLV